MAILVDKLASNAVVPRGLVLPLPPLWGGGDTIPLKTTAREATAKPDKVFLKLIFEPVQAKENV